MRLLEHIVRLRFALLYADLDIPFARAMYVLWPVGANAFNTYINKRPLRFTLTRRVKR
jgi:hypothetical protein